VFVAATLPAILKSHGKDSRALRERAMARRLQARAGAREGLRSPGYARAILEISKWLAQPTDAADDETLDQFAARVLSKRHARLVAGLERLPHADMGERHRVRIDAKRLRYVVEGLAPAMDAVAARRYAQNLSRLQDVLGSANDAVAGERLLRGLNPSPQLAAFAKHWLAGRIRGETGKIPRVADAITGARAFWHDH